MAVFRLLQAILGPSVYRFYNEGHSYLVSKKLLFILFQQTVMNLDRIGSSLGHQAV